MIWIGCLSVMAAACLLIVIGKTKHFHFKAEKIGERREHETKEVKVEPVESFSDSHTTEVIHAPDSEIKPTSLALSEVLARTCRKAGIAFYSTARKRFPIDVISDSSNNLKQSLTKAAKAAGIVFIEDDPNGIDSGTCTKIVLTDVAIYAGEDAGVVKLLTDMGDEEPEVRGEAIEGLSNYENPGFEPVFASILSNDPVPDVRVSAAIALEQAKLPSSIDLLIESLNDSDQNVREHARATLGVIGGKEVFNKLYEAWAVTNNLQEREIIEQILENVYDEPLFVNEE
jgi:hypothetical protein